MRLWNMRTWRLSASQRAADQSLDPLRQKGLSSARLVLLTMAVAAYMSACMVGDSQECVSGECEVDDFAGEPIAQVEAAMEKEDGDRCPDIDGDGVARCCEPGLFFATRGPASTTVEVWMYDPGSDSFPISYVVADSATLPTPVPLAVGDFDNNGNLDVIYERMISGVREGFMATCDQEWVSRYIGPFKYPYLGGADVDLDGNTDMLSLERAGWPVTAIAGHTALGNGGAGFPMFPVQIGGSYNPSPLLGAWGASRVYNAQDADSDGVADFMIHEYATGGASSTQVYFMSGTGLGTFSPPTLVNTISSQPQNLGDMGDLNCDGCTDWVGGGDDDGNRGAIMAMHGDCTGNFGAPYMLVDTCNPDSSCTSVTTTPGSGWTQLYDWDGDGDLELMTSRNQGSGAVIEYWRGDCGQYPTPTTIVNTTQLKNARFVTPLRN